MRVVQIEENKYGISQGVYGLVGRVFANSSGWVQSQVMSYQRLKKWYLMLPCLTLSIR